MIVVTLKFKLLMALTALKFSFEEICRRLRAVSQRVMEGAKFAVLVFNDRGDSAASVRFGESVQE